MRSDGDGQAGFTLLEALVSLAVILAFAGVLGPHLSQARRIMADADGRVAAQVLLRSLLDAPFDRSSLADMSRDGETAGLRWRVASEPIAAAARTTTELAGLSCDGECGVGLRSDHRRGNDPAPQERQGDENATEPNARRM